MVFVGLRRDWVYLVGFFCWCVIVIVVVVSLISMFSVVDLVNVMLCGVVFLGVGIGGLVIGLVGVVLFLGLVGSC